MDLEKLDSKLAVDVKTKRAAVGPKSSGFRLTERDLELLGFLLDQKFASLEQVYFRFFDVRAKVTDELPQNLFVTRQRLQVLRRAGLITTEKVFSESKSLYLLTTLGFQIFRARRPHDAFAFPAKDVDFRNYDHDTKVNDCRSDGFALRASRASSRGVSSQRSSCRTESLSQRKMATGSPLKSRRHLERKAGTRRSGTVF